MFIGSETRFADYQSGSGTSSLKFRYITQLSDVDSDGITMASSLDLNGGSLTGSNGLPARLSFTAPQMSGIKVVGISCPEGYVRVGSLPPHTVSPFCVAKYEMKNQNNAAVSAASGTPWGNITRDQSISACQNLGQQYDLISNSQWQTLAVSIESVPLNWSGGVIGSAGGLNRGHSDFDPVGELEAANDSEPCSGTGQTCDLSTWDSQRRVHQLPNSSLIWDLAGNVWEWVRDNNSTNFGQDQCLICLGGEANPIMGSIGGVLNTAQHHFGPLGNYPSLTSAPFGGLGFGWLNYSEGGIFRGGAYGDGDNTSVFTVHLGYSPETALPSVGFRCVWSPQ